MTIVYVQFSDASEAAVVSIFACPQDAEVFPYQGAIAETDQRYFNFLNPPTPIAQQVGALLSSGLTITSSATPSINGTYACDALSQADIVAIETSLNAGKGFPGGATALNYPDVAGGMHSFSEDNFSEFAVAVRDYVYALKTVIAEPSMTLPSNRTSIL